MGVWDVVGSWLGGQPKLVVELDSDRVAAGGMLVGRVTVETGRRGVDLEGVRVCLLRTAVRSRDGSPTGDIVQRTVVDAMVGAGLRLRARSGEAVAFAIRIPPDAPPSDDETSYRVRVEVRDGEGKGPSVQRAVRIVDAVAVRPDLEMILLRWPGLRAEATGEAAADALRELRFVHDPADSTQDFVAVEPRLIELLGDPDEAVREAALDAWGDVFAGRGGPPHIKRLSELLDHEPPPPACVRIALVAGRVASGPAAPLLERLSGHADASVRRAVVQAAAGWSRDVSARRGLVEGLMRDADPAVRAAVFRALVDYCDDVQVVEHVAAHTTTEPSSLVLEACIQTLGGALGSESDAAVRPVLERLAVHAKSRVRVAVARALHGAREQPWVGDLLTALLDDEVADVRAQTAAELRRFGAAAVPFLGRLEQLAAQDEDHDVRGAALSSLPSLAPGPALAEFFVEILDRDPPAAVVRGILVGIRHHPDPCYDSLVDELADYPDKSLAHIARDLL
jgi:HEAT repeat protein